MQLRLKENFRLNLRTAYERLQISQRRLGEQSVVHFTYINDILQGRCSPTLDIIEKLLHGLNKSELPVTLDLMLSAPRDFDRWLDQLPVPDRTQHPVETMTLDKLEVIAHLKKGLTPQQVAKLHDVNAAAIQKIEQAAIVAGLLSNHGFRKSHEERAVLRQQIAEWVASGGGRTVKEAAKHFHTSDTQVRKACEEHDVDPKFSPSGRQAKKASQTVVIAMMIDGIDQAEIARALNVSRQYVNICAKSGRIGGVFAAVDRAIERAVANAIRANSRDNGKVQPAAKRKH